MRFPGQYADPESGLYYNFHRTYDPNTGRYIQADPINQESEINVYAYVESSPLAFVDPTGLLMFIPPERVDRSRPTVICTSRGGVVPSIPSLPEPAKRCGIGDCQWQHEISHILNLRRVLRRPCIGRPAGTHPTFETERDRINSEHQGYSSEIACLRRKLDALPECDTECKKALSRWLEEVKKERRRKYRYIP
jgi:RHS repeat-associated protein